MRIWRLTFPIVAFFAMAFAMNSVSLASVAVGSSTLIQTPDYSDTFTLEANGGLTGRVDGNPLSGSALAVENNYTNPSATWAPNIGTATTSTTAGIADSGAGSDTGIVVNNDAWPDYGFAYGLRDNFVVQYDATIATLDGRVDIGIGFDQAGVADDGVDGPNGAILLANNLTVFFRTDESPNWNPGISLYNIGASPAEVATGLTTGLTAADVGVWHNFAVEFDLTERVLDFYVDEGYRGSVDIDDFTESGLDQLVLSNAYVNVGHHREPLYMDNVQVGAPTQASIPGDTNYDDIVDDTDASMVASHWGETIAGGASVGDFNNDGVVDATDASIMAANWGNHTEGCDEGLVPEPSVMALVLTSLFTLLSMSRARRMCT